MGDINNVLLISKCIPAVPAILRLKAVSRNIFPDRIMKASRIGVRTIFASPLLIQGNQKLAEKNPKYYGIIILKEKKTEKKKRSTCPVVTFKSMEMRCPAWSKIAKALSDKSNGCCC